VITPKPRSLVAVAKEIEKTLDRLNTLRVEAGLALEQLANPVSAPAPEPPLVRRRRLSPHKEKARRQKLRDAWVRRKNRKLGPQPAPPLDPDKTFTGLAGA
jgi:hypothetical protein